MPSGGGVAQVPGLKRLGDEMPSKHEKGVEVRRFSRLDDRRPRKASEK